MWIEKLKLSDFRCFPEFSLEFSPKANFLQGPNGAGKTSVLEAVYFLARGKSFRKGGTEALTRIDQSRYSIFAQIQYGNGQSAKLGVEKVEDRTSLHMNGKPTGKLGDFLKNTMVSCFEPGSHELLSGSAEERRSFLDWLVFHVEHNYLSLWRAYKKTLKQRNALLKSQRFHADQLTIWNEELAHFGEHLEAIRKKYLDKLVEQYRRIVDDFLPELGFIDFEYFPGWKIGQDFLETLIAREKIDRARGTTTVGPHRCEWYPRYQKAPHPNQLSRGQQKLTALILMLAQAELYAAEHQECPIILLDDLASELDELHLNKVVKWLLNKPNQLIFSGVEFYLKGLYDQSQVNVFHVEPMTSANHLMDKQ